MSKFFAAITGRDYLTLDGMNVGFWELLDRLPDGWLTSIVNIHTGLPKNKATIFDCGAWTYRNNDIPTVKNVELTAKSAYEMYLKHANPGDFLIAPDHMIIPGCDVTFRRNWNINSSETFIDICSNIYNPMMCIQGNTVEERVSEFFRGKSLGYKAFAVGGLAAQARNKMHCINAVESIMGIKDEQDWVHVLGLSAISFVKEWIRLNVSSFDGASHYYKALTAGYFYKPNLSEKPYIATKPNGGISDIPICNCLSCTRIKQNGGDTRYYGNSLNNIGRAAHNLNMFISHIKGLNI